MNYTLRLSGILIFCYGFLLHAMSFGNECQMGGVCVRNHQNEISQISFSKISGNEGKSFFDSMFSEKTQNSLSRNATPFASSEELSGFPLRLSDFRQYKALAYLQLNSPNGVWLDQSKLDSLRQLVVVGKVSGLNELYLPQLRKLTLSNIIPIRKNNPDGKYGMTLSEEHSKLSLSARLFKLEKLILSDINADFFVFESIRNLPIEHLVINHFEGKHIEFLKNMPIKKLTIRQARRLTDLEVLNTLPLEELIIDTPLVADYSFLRKLPLKRLQMKLPIKHNFQLMDLKAMPLEALHLINYNSNNDDFSLLSGKPISELVLLNVRSHSPYFLSSLPLRKLAIFQCALGAGTLKEIGKLSSLEQLAIGVIFDEKLKPINTTANFNELEHLNLKALSLLGTNLNFCRSMKKLTALKVMLPLHTNIGQMLSPLKGRTFDILLISGGKLWEKNIEKWNIKSNSIGEARIGFFFDTFMFDSFGIDI